MRRQVVRRLAGGAGILAFSLVLGGCVMLKPPVLTAPATPAVGDELRVWPGSYLVSLGNMVSRTYQWERCEADGTGCVPVSVPPEQSPKLYVPCASDIGKRFRARETVADPLFGTMVGLTGLTAEVEAWSSPPGRTTAVSTPNDCGPASGRGGMPAISGDGRYVAYESESSVLVSGDTNGVHDIFVWDRQTGATERVSVASGGGQGNGSSYAPTVSGDGRYVAFESFASNLVPGDTNGTRDVFLRDRQAGVTERMSVATDGDQGDEPSALPSISADGRYVAFQSDASTLVSGDTNGKTDVFVRDRQAGTSERVSVTSAGGEADGDSTEPSISGDGRYVAFEYFWLAQRPDGTWASGMEVIVRDRQLAVTELISVAYDGSEAGGSDEPSISADGRYVAFQSTASTLVSGDTNGKTDVFVRDRQAGATERVSLKADGSQATNHSYDPSISADGRYVALDSTSALVSGDTNNEKDVFVRDRVAGSTTRVSSASDGAAANGRSEFAAISADGRYVTYQSQASNLVPKGGTNVNAYIWDRDFAG